MSDHVILLVTLPWLSISSREKPGAPIYSAKPLMILSLSSYLCISSPLTLPPTNSTQPHYFLSHIHATGPWHLLFVPFALFLRWPYDHFLAFLGSWLKYPCICQSSVRETEPLRVLQDKGFIIGIKSYVAVGPAGDMKVQNGDSHYPILLKY